MNAILTIIIPAFNISEYIDSCFPSYVNDALIGKIKIVVVDDGSTDSTKIKVKSYLDRYPELFLYYKKDNGGHGSVINYAVHNIIETKYFKVIDGDDWVETPGLIRLVDYLYSTDDDLIVNNFVRVFPSGNIEVKCGGPQLSNAKITIHSVTFKTSIFKQNAIYVREHVFYEDNEFIAYPLLYIKTYKTFDYPIYYYRMGNPNQSVSVASMIKKHNDIVLVYDDLLNFLSKCKNENIDEENLLAIKRVMTGCIYFKRILLVHGPSKLAKKEMKELYKKISMHPDLISTIKKYDKWNKWLFICRFNFLHLFYKKIRI